VGQYALGKLVDLGVYYSVRFTQSSAFRSSESRTGSEPSFGLALDVADVSGYLFLAYN